MRKLRVLLLLLLAVLCTHSGFATNFWTAGDFWEKKIHVFREPGLGVIVEDLVGTEVSGKGMVWTVPFTHTGDGDTMEFKWGTYNNGGGTNNKQWWGNPNVTIRAAASKAEATSPTEISPNNGNPFKISGLTKGKKYIMEISAKSQTDNSIPVAIVYPDESSSDSDSETGTTEYFTFYINFTNVPANTFDGNDRQFRLHMFGGTVEPTKTGTAWPGFTGEKQADGSYKFVLDTNVKLDKGVAFTGTLSTTSLGQCTFMINNGNGNGYETSNSVTATFEHNGVYTCRLAGHKETHTLEQTGTYTPPTTYTVTANNPDWWGTNVTLGTLEVGNDTNWTTVTDNKVTVNYTPTKFRYASATEKDNSDYKTYKSFIDLPALTGDVTVDGTAKTITFALADVTLNEYTVTVNSYAGAVAPEVKIGETTLTNPTQNSNTYTYTFMSNKTDLTGTATVGSKTENITFTGTAWTGTFTSQATEYTITSNVADWWKDTANATGVKLQVSSDNSTWKDVTDGKVEMAGQPKYYKYTYTLDAKYIAANLNAITNSGEFTGSDYTATLADPNIKTYKLKVTAYENSGKPTVSWTGISVPDPSQSGNVYDYTVYTNKVSGNQTVSVQVGTEIRNDVTLAEGDNTVVFQQPTVAADGPFVVYIKVVNKSDGNRPSFLTDQSVPGIHYWGLKWNGTEQEPINKQDNKDYARYTATYVSSGKNKGFYKFTIGDKTNYPTGEIKTPGGYGVIFRPSPPDWDNKTKNLNFDGITDKKLVNNGYYIIELTGAGNKDDGLEASFTNTTEPSELLTYEVSIEPNGWNSYATLTGLQVKVGNTWQAATAKEGAANTYTVEGTAADVPTHFKFTGVTLNSDYVAEFIDLTKATAERELAINGTAYKGSLEAHDISAKNFTVTTFAGAKAPVVKIGNTTLTNPTPENYKYTFTITTNKTDLTGTVDVEGCAQQNIDFTNGNTFTDPRQDYTFYFDLSEPINNARESGDKTYTDTRKAWHAPTVHYSGFGDLTDGEIKFDSNSANWTKHGTGVYKLVLHARSIGKVWLERKLGENQASEGMADTRTNEFTPSDGKLHSFYHAKADDFYYTVVTPAADFTAGTVKDFQFTVSVPKSDPNEPVVTLKDANGNALCKPLADKAASTSGPERWVYTYLYQTCASTVDKIYANVQVDVRKKENQEVTTTTTPNFDFPVISTEYRLCGDAFDGWGAEKVDGVEKPADGGKVMTKNRDGSYTVTVESAEGFAHKNFVVALYTKEDGEVATRTALGVSATADIEFDGDITLNMTATAAEGQEVKTPFVSATSNASATFTFTPAQGKLDEGQLKVEMTADYAVAPMTNGVEKYYELGGLQYKCAGDANWTDATEGKTSKTKRPVAYQYTTKTAKDVSADYSQAMADMATANAENISVTGNLSYDGKAKVDTYMAKPNVYVLTLKSEFGAPTDFKFVVGDKHYTAVYTPAAAAKAPARVIESNLSKDYTYTLITNQHAENTTVNATMKVNGTPVTVTEIAPLASSVTLDPALPSTTETAGTSYVVHDELNICGATYSSDNNNSAAIDKLFPGKWDEDCSSTANVFTTHDKVVYTWTASKVPAGTVNVDGFGLRMKDYTNGKLIWLQGAEGNHTLTTTSQVQTYVEYTTDHNKTLKNMVLQLNLTAESDVTFVYVRDAGKITGTLSVYVAASSEGGHGSLVRRGTHDNVGGLDFSKATIQITKNDDTSVTINPGDAYTSVEFDDIKSAEFTDGVVIHDVDGKEQAAALNNFKYATSKSWPIKVEEDKANNALVFYAKQTTGAQYYSFCYHDWRTNARGAEKVEVKLANGTMLYAWHTTTPELAEGLTNPGLPEVGAEDKDFDANYGNGWLTEGYKYDKSYGMVATPPKGAPGKDFWFMVMTDLDNVDFENAKITVYPKAHEKSGAIPVKMTLTKDRMPTTDRVIRHCMNSQFRIYRVGWEVDWNLGKATEYVSNTGVFYVDGLKPNDTSYDQLGKGYKFSTKKPLPSECTGDKNTQIWATFNSGVFGYNKWGETREDLKDKDNRDIFWGNTSKEGNFSTGVEGTIVFDLRDFVNAENITEGDKYGQAQMHQGFFRQTTEKKMQFYGGVNVANNNLELTRIGLWNNDACQVVSFGQTPDYNKTLFYQIVGGFEAEVKDSHGNVIDANGSAEGTKFVYTKPGGMENFNEDYEFLNKDGKAIISLPQMLPGTYTITVKLLPVDGYKATWNDNICTPLVLNATIDGLPAPTAEYVPLKMVKVALGEARDADAAHKGHSVNFPVKYNAVNEAVVSFTITKPGTVEGDGTYAFKLNGKDVTVQPDENGYYTLSGLPVDLETKSIKEAKITITPTYTVDGVQEVGNPCYLTIPATSIENDFVNLFANIQLDQTATQVVVTGGTLNNAKKYVYSANPVFTATAGEGTTELYSVGGFEFNTANLRNVTLQNGTNETYTGPAEGFNDWVFGTFSNNAAANTFNDEPRATFSATNLKGLAGYSYYDGQNWDNDKNNWAEKMVEDGANLGFVLPHYYASATQYTGAAVPKHGGFDVTLYTVYPIRDAQGNFALLQLPSNKLTVNGDLTGSGVTGVENVSVDADALLDVYNMNGVRLMHNVTRQDALQQLQPGLYIIGREKVSVK